MNSDAKSSFAIEEATIEAIQDAYRSGKATARSVTQAHLDRIAAYDRKGPALGAIIVTNPQALADADALDAHWQKIGTLRGPLHGIPVLVKDNYDAAGLQTTGGSGALVGWVPAKDSTAVRKLREAGAIILAKTTMSEWARGGLDNINSVLPGFARNPYNTAHATGGSSGGTGGGLAASFGVVGLGSDTWGSIRNPSSNNALAGLRPSWALVSRAGMIGLYDARDTAGPMARSVTDLATLLDVIAGVDPDDPATAHAAGKIPPSYKAFLKPDGARGKRLGVLRQAFPPDASDPQVVALLEQAIADLRKARRRNRRSSHRAGIRPIPGAAASAERSARRDRALSRHAPGPAFPRQSPRLSRPRNSIRCTRSASKPPPSRPPLRRSDRRRSRSVRNPHARGLSRGDGARARRRADPAGRVLPAEAQRRPQPDADRRHDLDRLGPALARSGRAHGLHLRRPAVGIADHRPAMERAGLDRDRLRL